MKVESAPDADVMPLLMLASRLPKLCTVTGRSTEKPNGCRVVSGNVWPELTTVGTVMRPMVSDMLACK